MMVAMVMQPVITLMPPMNVLVMMGTLEMVLAVRVRTHLVLRNHHMSSLIFSYNNNASKNNFLPQCVSKIYNNISF